MNDQSNAALWAVNTAPSSRRPSSASTSARRGADRSERRLMPCTASRPDPLPRPPQLDQRRPLVDDLPVLDRDDGDLQDAVAAQRQPGGLDVDDGEPGQRSVR